MINSLDNPIDEFKDDKVKIFAAHLISNLEAGGYLISDEELQFINDIVESDTPFSSAYLAIAQRLYPDSLKSKTPQYNITCQDHPTIPNRITLIIRPTTLTCTPFQGGNP